MPEVFIYVQQEVLALAHTHPLFGQKKIQGQGVVHYHTAKGQQRPLHVLNGKAYLV
jgi:hypothetical protein